MRKLLLVLVLAVAACQAEGPELVLEEAPVGEDDLSLDPKADSVGKRVVVPIVGQQLLVPSQEYASKFVVAEEPTSARVNVKGDLIMLRMPEGVETLSVDIEPTSFFAYSTYRFLLYSSPRGGKTWSRVELAVKLTVGSWLTKTSVSQTVQVRHFESVIIDRKLGRIDFVGNYGGERIDLSAELGSLKDDVDYAVFAFPLDTIGSLKGEYNYTLNSNCGGGPCATK